MKTLFLSTAAALALMSGASDAGTIPYTGTLTYTDSSRGDGSTVSVPMFNPALGFLTAVEYRMTGTADAREWSDPGFNGNGVFAYAEARVSISFLNQTKHGRDTDFVQCGLIIYDPGRAPECAGHVEASAYASTEISGQLSIENGDNVPGQFARSGILVGQINGYSNYRFIDGINATLSITYTFADAPPDPLPAAYAALPLPASAPLLLAALGGIAILRKRRSKRV